MPDLDTGMSKPTPDPTILTTEQLLREITNLRDYCDSAINGNNTLMQERFRSVQTEFGLVERQRVEQKNDTKAAVDAALAAAKEAVKEQTTAFGLATAKSESATAKQLEQLTVTFTTALQGVTAVLNDLKTRVERLENIKQTNKEGITAIYAFIAFLVSVIILGSLLYGRSV